VLRNSAELRAEAARYLLDQSAAQATVATTNRRSAGQGANYARPDQIRERKEKQCSAER